MEILILSDGYLKIYIKSKENPLIIKIENISFGCHLIGLLASSISASLQRRICWISFFLSVEIVGGCPSEKARAPLRSSECR